MNLHHKRTKAVNCTFLGLFLFWIVIVHCLAVSRASQQFSEHVNSNNEQLLPSVRFRRYPLHVPLKSNNSTPSTSSSTRNATFGLQYFSSATQSVKLEHVKGVVIGAVAGYFVSSLVLKKKKKVVLVNPQIDTFERPNNVSVSNLQSLKLTNDTEGLTKKWLNVNAPSFSGGRNSLVREMLTEVILPALTRLCGWLVGDKRTSLVRHETVE